MQSKIGKKRKSRFLKYSWIIGLGIVPIVASACSVSTSLIKNSYLTNDDNFTSSLSLSDISTDVLKTSSGMQAYLKNVVNKILYDWLVKLASTNDDYKTLLDSEIDSVNKSYDNQVSDYKSKYGANWQLKFQQEVLDPSGGTKTDYINNQLYTFARTTLTNKLFSTLYLSVYDKSKNEVVLNPSSDDILSALKNTANISSSSTNSNSNYVFKFDKGVNLLAGDNDPDADYAQLQDFIFQKYVEYENPYIVNTVTWDYSTPQQGIESLYNVPSSSSSDSDSDSSSSSTTTTDADDTSSSDSSGDSSGDDTSSSSDTSTTLNPGTYAFPYFGNENATNTAGGTVSKFENFLSNAKDNYITDTDTGVKTIDTTYSDASSTLELVKNNSLFSDESAEFAAAVAYLYGTTASDTTSTTSQITNINSQITHNIDLTSSDSNGLDAITANFVSTTNPYTTTDTSTITPLQLSSDYLKKVVNSSGKLSTLADSSVYVIDNFIPGTITTSSSSSTQDDSPLNQFMFFRSADGVEAVSIDGSTLIASASSISEKKKDAGLDVIYRYLLGQYAGANFTVDLSSELSTFLSDNFDWLIYEYAVSSGLTDIDNNAYTQTMFDVNSSIDSKSDQALADAIANYLPAVTYYDQSYTAATKMYEAKKTYNQNYGYSVYDNGLASSFDYAYGTASQATNTDVSSNYLYQNALLASTANNPYQTATTSVNADSNTLTTSLYQTVMNSISSVVSNLAVQESEYSKYSQYLYSNNFYVNGALTSLLSESSFVQDEVENPILSEYIGDFYTVSGNSSHNTFNLSTNPFSSTNSDDSTSTTEIETYLANAMSNFYFLSSLTSESDSLFSYGVTSNTTSADITNASISASDVRNYSWDLWNSQNELDYATQLANYNTLYQLVASVKYLLDDNLSNFLTYMQNYIGSNQAYVVFQNSVNTNVSALNQTDSSTYTVPTSKSLINQTSLSTNFNNLTYGAYVGQSGGSVTTPLTYNLDSDGAYQGTTNSSYYSIIGSGSSQMVGFMGLQLSSSSSLPSDVSDAIYTSTYNNSINMQGCLYQYGSKEGLENYVNNVTTLDALSTLATSLDTATNYEYLFSDAISSTSLSLSEKKQAMVKIIDNLSESYFTALTGTYVGQATSTSDSTDVTAYSATDTSTAKYGTYVYELNASDFSSLSKLQAALGAKSGDANSYQTADEIICNLIVQFASDTSNQAYWLTSIIGDNRVEIYDIRIYNAFTSNQGILWISNWKEISSSSSSSSSSGSSSSGSSSGSSSSGSSSSGSSS